MSVYCFYKCSSITFCSVVVTLYFGCFKILYPLFDFRVICKVKVVYSCIKLFWGPKRWIYVGCFFSPQVYIHGDSLKSNLIAIIVVDLESIDQWAKKKGITAKSQKLLCEMPKLNELIMDDLNAVGKTRDLKSFEMVSEFVTACTVFSNRLSLYRLRT